MPAYISQTLPLIAFGRNEIKLVVQSVDYLDGVPAASVNQLLFNGAVAENTSLTISWAEGSATMKAKAVPDDSGRQFPVGDGGSAYVFSLVEWFQGNYFIDRDFLVSADDTGPKPVLLFTCRNKSPKYNFTDFTSGSVVCSVLTSGVSDAAKPNFMHHVQVWVSTDTGAFELAATSNIGLDVPLTGKTSINIGDILQAYLDVDVPSMDTIWQFCTRSIRKYYVRFGVFAGEEPFVNKVHQSGTYVVAFGGYSHLAFQQISDPINHLAKYLLPDPALYQFQRWFEAWPIDSYTVKTNQPQFIYFINSRSVTETFQIKADLVYSNSSTQTVYLAAGALQQYQKACIGCGYKQLGLDTYSTGDIKVSEYTLTMVESATLQSRSLPKHFSVDRSHEEYSRYFIYADSVGNFKTLRTWGKSTLSAEITSDTAMITADSVTTANDGNYRNVNVLAVHNDKVNTGYISSANEYDSLIELHLSRKVFRVAGQTLIPITITAKNFNYSSDGNILNADLLEYRLAYDDDLYTGNSYALAVPELNKPQQTLNDI